jgi:hypothetical protein
LGVNFLFCIISIFLDGLVKDACEVMPKSNQGKSLILVFSSTNEKREWLKEVKMLVKEFQKKEAQAAKEAKLKAAEEAALAATMSEPIGGGSNSFGATSSPSSDSGVINIAGVPNASKLSLTKSSSRTIKGPLVKSNSTSTMITPQSAQNGPTPATSPSPLRSSRASIFGKKPKEKKEKEEKEKKEDKKDKSKRASSSSIESNNNNNAAAPNKLKNSHFSKELAKTLKANAPPPKKF